MARGAIRIRDEAEPLHSLENEMAVLGSAMLDISAARWFAQNLPPEVFYRPAHRTIAAEIRECVEAKLEPSLQILVARLRQKQVLQDIGNDDYLIQVAEYVPSPASIRHYGKIVLDFALQRSVRDRCIKVATLCEDSADVDAILAQAFGIARNLPRFGTDTVMSADINVDKLAERVPGIKTPWPTLNLACRGSGWYFGESAVVIGHRGTGKTGLLVDAAIHAWRSGFKPAYVTLEMTAEDIVIRQMQALCGMEKPPRDTIGFAEWAEADRIRKEMNIPIYDPRKMIGGDRTVNKLVSWAEDARANLGIDLLLIDYAQKLEVQGKKENRTREMDYCADAIDDLLKTTGMAGVIGSQRSIDAHNKNDWRSKDSIKWEDNAALVIQVRRARNETLGKFCVSKNRHGDEPLFEVEFNGPFVRHREPEDPFAD